MTTFGYARVSSTDQNLARQIDALLDFPIERQHIFTDKLTGSTFDRPGWNALMKRLKPDDSLVVLSIDRLGRDYDEILEQWRFITRENCSTGI